MLKLIAISLIVSSNLSATDIIDQNNGLTLSSGDSATILETESIITTSTNSASDDINISNSDNGINSKETLGDIENSGIISANSSTISTGGYIESRNVGNGISNFGGGEIGNITNNGMISGNSTNTAGTGKVAATESGNGILNYGVYDVNIENIVNNGVISGYASSTAGNGATDARATTVGNGNGISSITSLGNSELGNIENNGKIAGEIILQGGEAGAISTGTNDSSAYSQIGGNGISSYSYNANSTINSIINSGAISGKATVTAGTPSTDTDNAGTWSYYSGNGISSQAWLNSNIGNIDNSGIISGEIDANGSSGSDRTLGYGNSTGNGIVSWGRTGSVIGDITNTGIVMGNASINSGTSSPDNRAESVTSGNGISSYVLPTGNGSSSIGNVNNSGIISGYASLSAGNSIDANGTSSVLASESGNGISITAGEDNWGNGSTVFKVTMGQVDNSGVISGYSEIESGTYNNGASKDYEQSIYSGNGIALEATKGTVTSGDINNSGVIKGTQSAIASNDFSTVVINNYGIMAGREIYSDGTELVKNDSSQTNDLLTAITPTNSTNYGTYVDLASVGEEDNIDNNNRMHVAIDTNGNVIAENVETGTNGAVVNGKTVINAEVYSYTATVDGEKSGLDASYVETKTAEDSEIKVSSDTTYTNNIINGAGIQHGALYVQNSNVTLNDSIVNAYDTAIYLEGDSSATLTNTVINGGGIDGEESVIKGDENNNSLYSNGSSVINGNIDLGAGNDTMKLSSNTKINGDITGGEGSDTLFLGDTPTSETNPRENAFIVSNEINDIENIYTTGTVILTENAKIKTDAESDNTITLDPNGSLVVCLDASKVNSDNEIIGHALYEYNGKMVIGDSTTPLKADSAPYDTTGTLVFNSSSLNEGTIIDLGGTDISAIENENIETNSIVHTAQKMDLNSDPDIYEGSSNHVEVTLKSFDDVINPPVDPVDPVDPPVDNGDNIQLNYVSDQDKLGKIYDSIVSSGQIGKLAPTTDTGNKSETDATIGLVSLLDQIYRNNPYAFATTMAKDAMETFREEQYLLSIPVAKEYWLTGKAIMKNGSLNDQESNSNINGVHTKNTYEFDTEFYGGIANFEYGLGNNSSVGFAFGGANQKLDMDHDSDLNGDILYTELYYRKNIEKLTFRLGAGYQYGTYDVDRNISNNYQKFDNNGEVDTNSIVLYSDFRFLAYEKEDLKVEPKLIFSYYNINQDSVSEDNGDLSMKTKSNKTDYFDTEMGLDVTKKFILNSGILNATASASYINSQGGDEEEFTGNIDGGSEFKMLGPDSSENNGKFGIKAEYVTPKGYSYEVGVNYEIGEEDFEETTATFAVGYKF